MLEANYLTMLVKPNFEKPVDTIQDILDRGLTCLMSPDMLAMVEAMKVAPSRQIRGLAARAVIAKVTYKVHLLIFSITACP